MYAVFRALLVVTHLLYSLCIAVHNFGWIAYRKSMEFWHGENSRTEVEILVGATKTMNKLPRHLIIIFGEKEDTIFDCIRIIGWCITLGIPYISFFDNNGFLVKNQNYLINEVTKTRPDLLEHITWGKPGTVPVKNGVTGSKPKSCVCFLSHADGRGEIVLLTQELANAVMTGSIKTEEINDNLLSEKLSLRGIPDPDLALVYGRMRSTYGVLPWHTRITEFLMFPSWGSLSVRDFTHLLEKYSNCEQRYGK